MDEWKNERKKKRKKKRKKERKKEKRKERKKDTGVFSFAKWKSTLVLKRVLKSRPSRKEKRKINFLCNFLRKSEFKKSAVFVISAAKSAMKAGFKNLIVNSSSLLGVSHFK